MDEACYWVIMDVDVDVMDAGGVVVGKVGGYVICEAVGSNQSSGGGVFLFPGRGRHLAP